MTLQKIHTYTQTRTHTRTHAQTKLFMGCPTLDHPVPQVLDEVTQTLFQSQWKAQCFSQDFCDFFLVLTLSRSLQLRLIALKSYFPCLVLETQPFLYPGFDRNLNRLLQVSHSVYSCGKHFFFFSVSQFDYIERRNLQIISPLTYLKEDVSIKSVFPSKQQQKRRDGYSQLNIRHVQVTLHADHLTILSHRNLNEMISVTSMQQLKLSVNSLEVGKTTFLSHIN